MNNRLFLALDDAKTAAELLGAALDGTQKALACARTERDQARLLAEIGRDAAIEAGAFRADGAILPWENPSAYAAAQGLDVEDLA